MIIETLRPMTIPGTGQIGAHEIFNAIAIGEFTVGIKFKEKNVVLTNGHKQREWREITEFNVGKGPAPTPHPTQGRPVPASHQPSLI
jgi:hypothetical protein